MTRTAQLLSPRSAAEEVLVTLTSLVSALFTRGRDYVGGRADISGQALAPASRVKPRAAPPFDFD